MRNRQIKITNISLLFLLSTRLNHLTARCINSCSSLGFSISLFGWLNSCKVLPVGYLVLLSILIQSFWWGLRSCFIRGFLCLLLSTISSCLSFKLQIRWFYFISFVNLSRLLEISWLCGRFVFRLTFLSISQFFCLQVDFSLLWGHYWL